MWNVFRKKLNSSLEQNNKTWLETCVQSLAQKFFIVLQPAAKSSSIEFNEVELCAQPLVTEKRLQYLKFRIVTTTCIIAIVFIQYWHKQLKILWNSKCKFFTIVGLQCFQLILNILVKSSCQSINNSKEIKFAITYPWHLIHCHFQMPHFQRPGN